MRVTFILVFLVSALSLSAQTQNAGNPIFSGWYADPEGVIIKNKYWIFPTYSDKYEKQVFMNAFSSKDLITWKKHDKILDTSAVKWAKRAMWAPSIIEKDKKYFLFFSANDIQNEQTLGGIGIAVAKEPQGPYKDYLGKPLLNQIVNGAQPIDQFVFKDKDGQYYMIYGGWRHCNITKLAADFKSLEKFDDGNTFKEITPEGYVEGPLMFIRDGKYYFMWSEGDWGGPNYKVAYAISNSVFGPFKRIGSVLQQNSDIAVGAGHHSVMQIPNTDEYYIVYHRRPKGETAANSRETCIEKMEFDNDGHIKPVTITKVGVEKRKLN